MVKDEQIASHAIAVLIALDTQLLTRKMMK